MEEILYELRNDTNVGIHYPDTSAVRGDGLKILEAERNN